jgi:hypothetical protein
MDEQRTKRRALVSWALRMTKDTSLAPSLSERRLLQQFVTGALTIEQVVALSTKKRQFWAQQQPHTDA